MILDLPKLPEKINRICSETVVFHCGLGGQTQQKSQKNLSYTFPKTNIAHARRPSQKELNVSLGKVVADFFPARASAESDVGQLEDFQKTKRFSHWPPQITHEFGYVSQ